MLCAPFCEQLALIRFDDCFHPPQEFPTDRVYRSAKLNDRFLRVEHCNVPEICAGHNRIGV
jgi:hypothetical protein